MTDALVAGVVRETLWTTNGTVNLAGVVREILVSGQPGLFGRASAKSSGSGTLTLASPGIVLQSTVAATSSGRAAATVTVALAGRIGAGAGIRLAQLPTALGLAGRIQARSRAQLVQPAIRVLQGRAGGRSRARGEMGVGIQYAGPQYAVSVTG